MCTCVWLRVGSLFWLFCLPSVLVGAVFYDVSLSFYNSLSILSSAFIRGSVRPGLLPVKSWCWCHRAFTLPPIKLNERWQGLRVLSGPEQGAPGSAHVPAWTPGQKNPSDHFILS